MAIKLKDLEVKDELDFFPGRKYDMEKVLALSDKNFAEFYLLKMREYKDSDGWWTGEKIPYCGKCLETIPDFTQLRRYYGNNLHPACFREFWKSQRKKDLRDSNINESIMMQYWDRVANNPFLNSE